ncbi:MAG: YraN family protein [Clostridia bacterium]|nr:YraN family protein [Clostridia bacterium]
MAQKNFYKKFLGRAGELKAAEFLKKKGFKILKTNYKTALGEIDIIAQDGDVLTFIEVKTRTDESFGLPSEAVNYKKQQKYYKIASYYLMVEKKTDVPCRFDVVEIENGQINHILNAFTM